MTAPNDRFHELRSLLRSYEVVGYAFDDTEEQPGAALDAYLRQAALHPARAARAAAEIDDLLTVGLFSSEIADDVDLLPHINPPQGESVESCLAVVRNHLASFLAEPGEPSRITPRTSWEWKERFPEFSHLLGSYFHQDFSHEYSSHKEALDDYISGVSPGDLLCVTREMQDFLSLSESDHQLKEAAATLGLRVAPPRGVRLRQWLVDVQGIIAHHLQG
ncbi:contact-dependent growth inhibition system immunity protein [Streptomyces xanthochromogenes]|uniref:contact-dependent growth inhibition system immunity protein n=1 Tax=Streptomyces xanthochromogenes TaxID=67384 RepID=UPI00343A077C